ncbi:hypothetical protein ACFSTC_22510 [Nonomuraea ferruginea]
MDHRQGRPDPGPAGGRDPGGHGQVAERALPGPDRAVRRARLRAGGRASHPRGEGGARQAVGRPGDGLQPG